MASSATDSTDPTVRPLFVVAVVLDILRWALDRTLLLVFLIREVYVCVVLLVLEESMADLSLLVVAHSKPTSFIVALVHVASSVALSTCKPSTGGSHACPAVESIRRLLLLLQQRARPS